MKLTRRAFIRTGAWATSLLFLPRAPRPPKTGIYSDTYGDVY